MIFRNLLRRKGRTLLTILGISIGVAAIIVLGSLAGGLESGYSGMMSGSKADLVLSQPDSYDLSLATVDQKIEADLAAMPEVKAVSGMVQGLAQTEGVPYFFIFGYPEDSFALKRFQVQAGSAFYDRESKQARGKPIMLGASAAETLKKSPGDTIRVMGTVFRVTGIYQTGDSFEDSGAVMSLANSQELMGKTHQVSLFYIQLKEPEQRPRLQARVERRWPDLLLAGSSEFAKSNSMAGTLRASIWAISGLAIVIGGVGMMNAQLMAVFERTREIGVLRAVGWGRARVLALILGESVLVCLLGGLAGLLLGWLCLRWFGWALSSFGASASQIQPALIDQSLGVVLVLGLGGGLYPAWHASRLLPVEALRYEGGSGSGKLRRFPLGGMAVQSLWQRSTRTFLTLSAIALTVGAILALDSMVAGVSKDMTNMFSSDSEIMLRQKEVSDTSQSAIDERVGDKIASLPEVQAVSGMAVTAVMTQGGMGFALVLGYEPGGYALNHFNVVEGQTLSGNRQVLIGRRMAESWHKRVGDTMILSGGRYRIMGIFESAVSWEEMGAVISLRDAQTMVGRPRKVTIYTIKVQDSAQAPALVERLNREYPDLNAALTGDFVDQMPDMQATGAMTDAIAVMAVLVGGLGVMNTMLMSVLERTREIGVLRALGWRRRSVLLMILRESLLLALLGGLIGIAVSFGMAAGMNSIPLVGEIYKPVYTLEIYARALGVALLLGLAGGLYPAFRATRQQPVEALRYE